MTLNIGLLPQKSKNFLLEDTQELLDQLKEKYLQFMKLYEEIIDYEQKMETLSFKDYDYAKTKM